MIDFRELKNAALICKKKAKKIKRKSKTSNNNYNDCILEKIIMRARERKKKRHMGISFIHLL